MARFVLLAAHFVGSTRLKAGRTIADTQGNAIAGDYVWLGLSSSNITPDMQPLDGGATTMKSGSQYANTPVRCTCTGVSSIDG